MDVDLNLNTYRDYSSGGNEQRTDLSVAVSKSFLDDRLSISVGRSFAVEGEDPASKYQQKNNNFLPDVTVQYKLTKDGKYLVRAYSRSQYEVLLEGYVVENGLSFVVTMDYNTFKELFRKK
jgi:translocation and assembly module TamB